MSIVSESIPQVLQYLPNENKTRIQFEKERIEYVEKTSFAVLEEMCLRHGSTVQGRRDAICAALGIKQKAPILISEISRIMYFPLTSPQRHPDTIWLCYNHIHKCLDNKDTMSSTVLFKDGSSIVVQEQSRTILKQCRKCRMYLNYLREQEDELPGKIDLAQLKERFSL